MNSYAIKGIAALVGVFTIVGAIYGTSQVFATKVELAQTDAKADYSLFALLAEASAQLTRLKDKPAAEKTVEDWKQIAFLEKQTERLRNLISGDE